MWSLYNEKGDILKPLLFSNGKTQESIVNEVVSSIKAGHKVIFIRGVCGTGKSAIALNIGKELGKASIVVPIKSLQKQYEDDYTNKKYLLKDNGEKMKIKIMTGRENHSCPFLKEGLLDPLILKKETTEKNAVISDFTVMLNKLIEKKNERKIEENKEDFSCNNQFIPCKIELKEKNMKKVLEYIKMNNKLESRYFDNIQKVRRLSIAPICPYWSPIIPAKVDLKMEAKRLKYAGLNGREYNIYKRKQGCGYYDQFDAYVTADVLIFNSRKYQIETVMNRKPATDVEIIDECDEFLDSFANTKKINIDRLKFALGSLFTEDYKTSKVISDLMELVDEISRESKLAGNIQQGIIPIKNTKIIDILRGFLDSNFMEDVECDEENYCYHCDEVAQTFEDFFDETYTSFSIEEDGLIIRLVTTNLEKRFKELLDKSKAIVMMSGTIHSEKVLKDIFGLKDFKIIDAEIAMPGSVTTQKTGTEIYCNYTCLQQAGARERYLLALSKCIEIAKKPLLIHVTAFKDLPNEKEAEQLKIDIITQEKLRSMQKQDSESRMIKDFKQGKTKILFSTKCNRGVDFPGEVCNSIIITRYPYPNVSSVFWKILKETKPEYYNEFYMDKSKREFLQRIYRGLRSVNDHIFLLSPDTRVLNAGKTTNT